MERLKDICFREITSLKHYIRGPMVEKLFRALEETYEHEIVREAHIKHRKVMEESLENVVNKMTNLSSKVEELNNEVNDLKSAYSRVENLNGSYLRTSSEVESMRNAVSTLQRNYQQEGTLKNSLASRVQVLENLEKNSSSSIQTIISQSQEMRTVVVTLKHKYSKVETLDQSLRMTANKSELIGSGLKNLQQHLSGNLESLNSSLQIMENKVETLKHSHEITTDKTEGITKALNNLGTSLNGSVELIANKVEVVRSDLMNLQNVTSDLQNLKTSVRMIVSNVDGLTSTSLYYSQKSKSFLQGLIVGTTRDDEVVTISLPSLQQNVLYSGSVPTIGIAFDPSSRKVYWAHGLDAIKMANLDGTDVKDVVQGNAYGLAVDSSSGNIYYGDYSAVVIRVCSRASEKCSTLATNQRNVLSIALYPSKSLMFWTNETSTVQANMDGTNASVIISQEVVSISVDEDSERLYWIDSTNEHIFSSDLDGNARKVLLKDTNADLGGIAVHGDTVYFGGSRM